MRATVLIMRPWVLLPVLCLASGVLPASPGDDAANAIVFDGDFFQAGNHIVLEQPVAGDALLAGATVESNASIEGDASMAGGQVAVRATVGEDLYAIAGELEVDALVSGSARLAGGRVRITPASRIDGGVAIAGGTVDAEGQFGRYLTVTGGDVILGGSVDGDVRIYAEQLTVLPGTRIGGQLRYRTTSPAVLPGDLQVGAGVRREADGGNASRGWRLPEAARSAGWLWLIGLFALGLLLAYAFAGFSRRTSAALGDRPWAGMGVGLLVLVGIPVLAMVLALTLVGLPLALMLVLAYLAMLIAAYVVGALYLGDRALAAARPGQPSTPGRRLLALLLVLLVLAAISQLPLLGKLVRFAVLLLGLGGIALALRRRRVPGAGAGPAAAPAAG